LGQVERGGLRIARFTPPTLASRKGGGGRGVFGGRKIRLAKTREKEAARWRERTAFRKAGGGS